jgi:AhpD family alkylhydroperoxidase
MSTSTAAETATQQRVSTARVSLRTDGLLARAVNWYARHTYGMEMEPMQALLSNRPVVMSIARFEMSLRRWKTLDSDFKELISLAVASQIGCSWCMDFGYYVLRTKGMSRAKLEQVADWRDSTLYTPLERKALAYAEAMTATPPTVTDEMVAGLREELTDAQVVELTSMISVENIRSRTNFALGLTSQGFEAQCDLPRSSAQPRSA